MHPSNQEATTDRCLTEVCFFTQRLTHTNLLVLFLVDSITTDVF